MAKNTTSSKRHSPAPALVGREGELERLRVLLNASGAFVPVILGRSGTGKTALLRAMAAQFAPAKVTVMNAANCVESLPSLSKSKWLPVDNLHRLTQEQVIRLLDWLDQWRIGKNNRAVLTHDTDIGAEEFAALLQKYPFVKPIHLAPLSQTATAHVLEQFAAARGVVAPRAAITRLVSTAADFFPARALPGSAVDAFDWLLAAAPQKDLMSGRAWTTEAIMAQLEKFSALPRHLLGRSLDERIRSFPGDNVGLLDQLRLSQAARGMADLLSERLLKNPARRKPLGSFILAGINPVMAHEFARAYVEHCHGATGTVVRILLSGRSRQETPEIFARIRGQLRGKSGGVIVMEEIAAATPHFLETLETILEEGDGPALTRVIFLFPTTVGESLMGNAGFLPSQLQKAVIREVKTQLPPPVWRRTDAIHIADTE